jgi:hypothetical protein
MCGTTAHHTTRMGAPCIGGYVSCHLTPLKSAEPRGRGRGRGRLPSLARLWTDVSASLRAVSAPFCFWGWNGLVCLFACFSSPVSYAGARPGPLASCRGRGSVDRGRRSVVLLVSPCQARMLGGVFQLCCFLFLRGLTRWHRRCGRQVPAPPRLFCDVFGLSLGRRSDRR